MERVVFWPTRSSLVRAGEPDPAQGVLPSSCGARSREEDMTGMRINVSDALTALTAPSQGAEGAEVVESWSRRVHRPLDLIRLSALLLCLLLITGLAVVGRDTSRGASADLARLLDHVPAVFDQLLRLVSAFGALAVPLALIVREVLRDHRSRLIEAVLTGFLAIGVAEGIDRIVAAFPSSGLYGVLTKR